MLELITQYRGPINLLLIFVLACFVLFRVVWLIQKEMTSATAGYSDGPTPQNSLLSAVDTAAAIGTGIVWTALIYTGPSLAQLWRGQGSGSHWIAVLLYTWVWLTARSARATKSAAPVLTSVIVRAAWYGIFFLFAISALNNW